MYILSMKCHYNAISNHLYSQQVLVSGPSAVASLSLSLSVHCHTAGTLTKDTFPANFPRNIMSIHVQQCNIRNTECHESTIIAHALILKSLIKMGSII